MKGCEPIEMLMNADALLESMIEQTRLFSDVGCSSMD